MWIEITKDHRTRFTRKCISEAIIQLLKDTEYEKLRVSAIVKRAGISRMTFYKYYNSPKDALSDYVKILISEYLEESHSDLSSGVFLTYDHILFSLLFFDRYRDYFLTMSRCGLYSILIDAVNGFMEEHLHTNSVISKYEVYSYSGGLLNTFLKWEELGKKEDAENIAASVHFLYSRLKTLGEEGKK